MTTYQTPTGPAPNLCLQMLREAHILVAGTTGAGKSTLINAFIYTALYRTPDELRLVLIDPKRVELARWRGLPHTLAYADEGRGIAETLDKCVALMESRYRRMQSQGVRASDEPAVWVIVDELADLITTDRARVEPALVRLAQLGRAANIHLLLATQTPHRSVITAQIKLNLPCSVALRCRESIESRLVMGCKGAENLPMHGRGFYASPTFREPTETAIPMISEEELTARESHWRGQGSTRRESPSQGFLAWLVSLVRKAPRR